MLGPLLSPSEVALIRKAALKGYLPLEVLGPLENESNRHFVSAMQIAESDHKEEEDGCEYPFSAEDEQLRLYYNAKIDAVMRYWEQTATKEGREGA